MEDLTTDAIIAIHDTIIKETGGADGTLHQEPLNFLTYKLQFIESPIEKASFIMFYITAKRPFVDGNKRTALTVAFMVLNQEGYRVVTTDVECIQLLLDIGKGDVRWPDIQVWLEGRIEKL